MEFIEGRTLEEVLQQDGPLSAREAALVGIDLSSALAAVHAQGLLHRDIKTRNVMREDGGRIVLMDFGAGRDQSALSLPGPITGTPLYMAPEVLRAGESSRQSDLYSLGVLLFRLVTGRYPVEGRSSQEVLNSHNAGKRQQLRDLRPDLPPWFIAAINRTLAVDPADRFAGPAALESALSPTHPTAWSRGQQLAAALSLVLLIGVAVAALWFKANARPDPASVSTQVSGRRIAVRPFKNLTGDKEQDYFAAGLTEILLAHLGGIKALKVTEVTNAQQAAPPDLYGWIEGSVQRNAGRIRITARLVETGSRTTAWGNNYEGAESEAFNLQGQMAADIAKDLGVSVTDTESRRLTRKYVANPAAQDAYLRGRYLIDNFSRNNLIQARREFEDAIRLDPDYAPAYARLATTYLEMVVFGLLTPSQVRDLAPAAAEAAFAKDPLLAEAALAKAEVRFRLGWDWGAESDYRLAVDLNPSDVGARNRLARFLWADERLDEAEAELRTALSIDPTSNESHTNIGVTLFYRRQYEDSVRHYQERSTGRTSGHVGLARSLAGAGRYPEAIKEMTAAVESSSGDPTMRAELARMLAVSGAPDQARGILQELTDARAAKTLYIAPQDLAYVYIGLGDLDRALGFLEEAVQERASRLLWLTVDPRVDALRDQPRFKRLLHLLGRP
jgi:serine/threonine-protein kinase